MVRFAVWGVTREDFDDEQGAVVEGNFPSLLVAWCRCGAAGWGLLDGRGTIDEG